MKAASAALAITHVLACDQVPSYGAIGRSTFALESDCAVLGPDLVGHACLHTTAGPYQTVMANPVRAFDGTLPHVNETHTHYTVFLPPDAEGTVKYRPLRGGEWVIFSEPPSALLVLDARGDELPLLLQHGEAGCSLLPDAKVYSFAALETYRIVLPPADAGRTALLIERLEDFQVYYLRDADLDGYGALGDAEDFRASACAAPDGWVAYGLGDAPEDCDDEDPSVHPGAQDACDGRDRNCDGVAATDQCSATDAASPPDVERTADAGESASPLEGRVVIQDRDGCALTPAALGHPRGSELPWLLCGLGATLTARCARRRRRAKAGSASAAELERARP